MMGIEVGKLHPLFAAELRGVDTAQPDAALVGLVEDLMREYAVVCIRGQSHIDDEQQLAFARAFGPLELPGNAPHNGGRVAFGLYDVSNLAPDGSIIDPDSPRARISKGNELFHADSSFNDLPSKWSMLRGVIVTPEGGQTETIDMRAVYDALPQATRQRIEGLEAQHNYFHSRRKAGAVVDESSNPLAPYMRSVHPVVRTSASGRKALFVGAHTQRILGIDERESAALLEELIAFATQPHFVYAHTWREGDILIWDNRCTLHRGTEYDYRRHRRDMRRATINESGDDRSAIPTGLSLQMLSEPAKAPAD
ncbi:MAG TPA: TauD/TfdA family dioxygenase [Croceibacterium sp.]|nr:TauD/TfdA family dioxygenase [Croceibacterium sp.]